MGEEELTPTQREELNCICRGGAGDLKAFVRFIGIQLFRMLNSLVEIATNTGGGEPAVSRAPTCVAHTSGTATTAGSQRTTFLASSDFVGSLMGQDFAAGASLTIAPKGADTLGATAFTRSAGTLFEYRLD
jgi:hypothetical protein